MTQTLGNICADFESQLATKIAIADASATILSAVDDDGVSLATGKYYLTIDGNNSSKEHIFCTLTGTSLTDIQSVSRQGVVTNGCSRVHRIGAKVILTDFANLRFISKQLDGSMPINATVGPLIYDANPTITDDKHLVTKKYVDDTAIAGSPLSTNLIQGISKLSVAAVSTIDPIVVGDNDTRIPTQDENDALAGSSGIPSAANKFVTAADVTEAKTASKIARRDANSDILVATTPTSGDAAASKTYVDGGSYLIFKSGTASKDCADASTTQNIAHGLGRIPKRVRLDFSRTPPSVTASNNGAIVSYNGTTQTTVCYYVVNTNSMTYSNSLRLNQNGSAIGYNAGVVTFDATNIIITWTKSGNDSTGTYNIMWEAEI